MPFPKRLSAPFRRSSYSCSLIPTPSSSPSPAKSNPQSRPRSRNRPRPNWICHPRRASVLSSNRTRHPHPNATYTTADPPIRPHYFDSYTGTWSPRKTPSTPSARRSGIWSPRQIASRIATPIRRPTTPVKNTSSSSPPLTPVSISTSTTGTAEPVTPTPWSMQMLQQHPVSIAERPPSRGKGPLPPPPHFPPLSPTHSKNLHAHPHQYPNGAGWARIAEEDEDEGILYQPNNGDDGHAERIGKDNGEEKPVTVTKVALPAREDVRPQSRDWADPGGGWGVIDAGAETAGSEMKTTTTKVGEEGEVVVGKEEGGMRQRKKKEVVILPAVMHEVSVLPVVERVA